MKKIIALIMCIMLAVAFCSCEKTKYDEVTIGMTYDEFESFLKGKDVFTSDCYAFWRDENGNEFAVEFWGNNVKVNRIASFSRQGAKPTSEDFESIVSGMGMLEVVERVGIPFRSVESGFATFDFLADDGTVYRISFRSSGELANSMCTFGAEEYMVSEIKIVE